MKLIEKKTIYEIELTIRELKCLIAMLDEIKLHEPHELADELCTAFENILRYA